MDTKQRQIRKIGADGEISESGFIFDYPKKGSIFFDIYGGVCSVFALVLVAAYFPMLISGMEESTAKLMVVLFLFCVLSSVVYFIRRILPPGTERMVILFKHDNKILFSKRGSNGSNLIQLKMGVVDVDSVYWGPTVSIYGSQALRHGWQKALWKIEFRLSDGDTFSLGDEIQSEERARYFAVQIDKARLEVAKSLHS